MARAFSHSGRRASGLRGRGSILVVVLVSLVFATAALVLFVRKAGTDLLVEVREADAQRLRIEAYSAMETVLTVLDEFRRANDGLRSPRQGWDDPFQWCDYQPAEGYAVSVTFTDESGRISLPQTDFVTLTNLFERWEVPELEAERWADALLGWMKRDYTPKSITGAQPEDYERAPLPFKPPGRSLRSWDELRSIDVIREAFFDEQGRPNDYARRFKEAVSLLDYKQLNVNAAPPDALGALVGYDDHQLRQLGDYFGGTGAYASGSRGYFDTTDEIKTVLGDEAATNGFGVQIRALRVSVTVRQGRSSFGLTAVVAPPGGATAVPVGDIPEPEGTTASGSQSTPATSSTGEEAPASLNYPFTILEITENDVGSNPPPTDPPELP